MFTCYPERNANPVGDAAIGVEVALLMKSFSGWLLPQPKRRKRPHSAFTFEAPPVAVSEPLSCSHLVFSYTLSRTSPRPLSLSHVAQLLQSLLTIAAMNDLIVRKLPRRRTSLFVIDNNSFAEDDGDFGWSFPLLAPPPAAEMGGQDPHAGLGPVLEASHGQRRPTPEDSPSLRQHDAGSSHQDLVFAQSHPDYFIGQSARMCCATPGRAFPGEKTIAANHLQTAASRASSTWTPTSST
jgi:hypothetical protein